MPWDSPAWQAFWAGLPVLAGKLLIGLVILLVAVWVGGLVQRLLTRVATHRRLDTYLTELLTRTVKLALIVVGIVTALGTVGVDVSALVASLGLTAFAIGFALKDIISNALSGMLVILYKPFKNGDRISVTALEGTVADVNLRYTVLSAEGKRRPSLTACRLPG